MPSKYIHDEGGFPAQRRASILQILRARKSASVQELAREIKVSTATIRRDLDHLAQHDAIERCYGGAMLSLTISDSLISATAMPANAQGVKRAIGRCAAQQLQAGQRVIFDSGSTVLAAVYEIIERNIPLTAVTNDVYIASLLADASDVQVIVPGGVLRPQSYTLMGDPARGFLKELNVDVALMGMHALAHGRFSDTSLEVATLKQQLMGAAAQVVVLMDSSKCEVSALRNVCSVEAIDMLITDKGIASHAQEQLEERGVRVLIADSQEDT